MSSVSVRQQEIRESILKFLEARCVEGTRSQFCPYCGKLMSMIPATFSLCGTELTRTVHLPACDCRSQANLPKIA